MNKSNSFGIDSDLFLAAITLIPGERGALSPLGEFGGEPLSKRVIQRLKKTGLITSSGNIEANFQNVVLELLDPVQVFNLDLVNRDREESFALYFKDPKSDALVLKTHGDKLEILSSNSFEIIKDAMDTCFPGSLTAGSAKTLAIPLEHAWTLVALLDLQRRKPPSAKSAKGFTRKEITAALTGFNESPAWLWLCMLSILAETEPHNGGTIDNSLSWLSDRKLLTNKENKYLPAGEAGEIASQNLQPSCVMNLLSAQKVSNLFIDYQKMACVASQNAFTGLAYRVGEENVHFLRQSKDDFYHSIQTCVEKAFSLLSALNIPHEEILSIPCPACGQLQNPVSKFCKDCGEALSAGVELEKIPEPAAAGTTGSLRGRLSQKPPESLARGTAESVPAKKKMRWWLIPLIILGVISLGCLIASLFVPITIRF